MRGTGIRREEREGEVVVLRFDRPGSSVNLLDRFTLFDLDARLRELGRDPPFALVLASAKRSVFLAGADVREIARLEDPRAARDLVEAGQIVCRRLAAFPAPTVAEIHGACLGGGLELALAADYRIASDAGVTRLGFPEVSLGILPAFGGMARATRLLGLPTALGLVLGGRRVPARRARRLGLVDEVVPRGALPRATADLLSGSFRKRPARRIANHRFVAAMVARRARKQTREKTGGHYPAPERAIEAMARGVTGPLRQALDRDRDAVLGLAGSPVTRNLVRIFLLREAARGRPEERVAPRTAAVIGAGTMGAGIAWWFASHGTRVLLRDVSRDRMLSALVRIGKLAEKAIRAGVLTPLESRDATDRVHPVTGRIPLFREELVIEAVPEDLALKREILSEAEHRAGPGTLLATNTSSLPVARIAEALVEPSRLVGLHFFHPVEKMELVEVVRPEGVDPACLKRGLAFARGVGKVPVVVEDRPGFLVNRVLLPYFAAALELRREGVPVRDVDETMVAFGMPMGPFRLLDEVGLDIARDAEREIGPFLGDRNGTPELLDAMVRAGELGRKAGRGFYVYDGGPPVPAGEEGPSRIPPATIAAPLVHAMVGQAKRCLEEGVVASAGEIDLALVLGAGFAPFRGGPLRYGKADGGAG